MRLGKCVVRVPVRFACSLIRGHILLKTRNLSRQIPGGMGDVVAFLERLDHVPSPSCPEGMVKSRKKVLNGRHGQHSLRTVFTDMLLWLCLACLAFSEDVSLAIRDLLARNRKNLRLKDTKYTTITVFAPPLRGLFHQLRGRCALA